MGLYENIKKRRKELHLSQQELAELTEYTDRSSISKIEAGEVDLPQSKIRLFAQALRTTEGALMGRTDDPAISIVNHTVALNDTINAAQQIVTTLAETEQFDSAAITHPNVERVLSVAQQATAAELLDATDYLEFQIKKRKK